MSTARAKPSESYDAQMDKLDGWIAIRETWAQFGDYDAPYVTDIDARINELNQRLSS